jgi:tripartite-type tricarboxylate transporter receptor subunit TctC
MKKEVKKILAIIVIIVSLIILFQSIDSARAKDPEYPTKPITYYIGFGAGGTVDVVSRAFCNTARNYLGQPLIPINKVGGGGTLTGMTVMTSKPDGYTFGSFGATAVVTGPLTGEAPYKDISGFTIMGNFSNYIFPLIVRSDAPWRTWKELIEWARENPGGLKHGIAGSKFTSMGIPVVQVEKAENVKFTYVPFKSSAEVLYALLGGHIHSYGSTIDASTMDYIKEGKLRILAFMDQNKVRGYENIPSFQELYGISMTNVMGTLGPKALPDYVLKKWDDAFAKVVNDPDFVNVLNKLYMPLKYMHRVQITKHIEEMYLKEAEILRMLKAEEEEKEKK